MHDAVIAVIVALSGLMTLAVAWGVSRLHVFIKNKVESEYVEGVLVRATNLVEEVVLELKQTIVDDLKESGGWNAETAVMVRDAALAKVKEYLGPEGMRELLEVLGLDDEGLQSILITMVEAAVARIKAAL